MFWDTFKVLVLAVLTVLLVHLLLQLVQKRVRGRVGQIGFGLGAEASFARGRGVTEAFASLEQAPTAEETFGEAVRSEYAHGGVVNSGSESAAVRTPTGTRARLQHISCPRHRARTPRVDRRVRTAPATRASTHSPAAAVRPPSSTRWTPTTAASGASSGLEDELKAWMAREASSWATDPQGSPKPPSVPAQQATSLDQVFAEQQVNMSRVLDADAQTTSKRGAEEVRRASVSAGADTGADTSSSPAKEMGASPSEPNAGAAGVDVQAFDGMEGAYASV